MGTSRFDTAANSFSTPSPRTALVESPAVDRPAPAAGRTCCGPAGRRAIGRPGPDPPPDHVSLRSQTRMMRSAWASRSSGPLDAGALDGIAADAQSGRVAQFHHPAVDGRHEGDGVAGGAGGRMNDRPIVAGQRVDQAALADVDPAGQHHPPRFDQMPAQRRRARKARRFAGVPRAGRRGRSPAECRSGAAECAMVLVQEDGGRAFGAGVGQRRQGRRGGRHQEQWPAAQSGHARRWQPAAISVSSIMATAARPP